MSTESCCFVIRVPKPEPHPNADALDIINVHGGYPCIVKKGSFQEGDLATYVPVDSLVPVDAPDFAFLASKAKMYSQIPGAADRPRYRIRAMRLRDVFSMGLLIPPLDLSDEGDDETDLREIVKYELPELTEGTERDPGYLPVYDIEGVRNERWASLLTIGEEVVIEEKIDGQNARFLYKDGRLWTASRTRYWRPDGSSAWARAAIRYDLERRLASYPGLALFGEVTSSDKALTVFDVRLDNGEMAGFDRRNDILAQLSARWPLGLPLQTPPMLYRGPWRGLDAHADLAEGQTLRPGATGIREGWVVRPVVERTAPRLGRLILKLHGKGWQLKKHPE